MRRKIWITRNGKVAYWISEHVKPSRMTLFFLHGLTADHRMFDPQIAYFENKYNLIVWDAPAHGESRPCRSFSFHAAADHMKRILDDHHIENVVFVGQSLGGYFAQAFIRKYPESVRGFVSIGSTPFGNGYYSRFDKWILRQVEWMARLYPLGMMKTAMAKQVSVTQRAYNNMVQMLAPYRKKELCHLMGMAYRQFLEENDDMEIPCPVLLLVGEHDKTGKVMAYNKAWARKERYPLIRIPDAAHNANVDNPLYVNRCIEKFVRNL